MVKIMIIFISGDANNHNKTTIFVDVIDIYGAKQRITKEITVKSHEIDEESFQKEISSIKERIVSDPIRSGGLFFALFHLILKAIRNL